MPWTEGPALNQNDIIAVTVFTQMGDQAGLNVYHYRVGPIGDANNGAFGKFMELFAGNNDGRDCYRNVLSNPATFLGYKMQVIRAAVSVPYFWAQAGGGGLAGAAPLPRQSAGFIRKVPNQSGRRKGGRVYIPFPSELDNDDSSVPTTEYTDRLVILAQKFLMTQVWGAGGANTAVPLIYKRTVPGNSSTVASFQAIRKWATQRRRGSFGRVNANPFT